MNAVAGNSSFAGVFVFLLTNLQYSSSTYEMLTPALLAMAAPHVVASLSRDLSASSGGLNPLRLSFFWSPAPGVQRRVPRPKYVFTKMTGSRFACVASPALRDKKNSNALGGVTQ
jgi:hypothetical protein